MEFILATKGNRRKEIIHEATDLLIKLTLNARASTMIGKLEKIANSKNANAHKSIADTS